MTYTVNVVNQVNTVTVVDYLTPSITVNDTTGGIFTITETLNTVSVREIVNTQTIYFDAIELKLNDLNDFWRGEWISNHVGYLHGDLVSYQYSIYLLNTYDPDTTSPYPPTTTPPDQDPTWRRIVWNEAPKHHLTITNYLNVGTTATVAGATNLNSTLFVFGTTTLAGNLFANNESTFNGRLVANSDSNFNGTTHINGELTLARALDHLTVTNHLSAGSLSVGSAEGDGLYIAGTSTFVGTATFLNDVNLTNANLTARDVTVNRQLTVDGLRYPQDKGLPYQILMTNGVNQAAWANIGDGITWALNTDLGTYGYNIVSGNSSTQLTIGNGPINQTPQGYLKFENNKISLYATNFESWADNFTFGSSATRTHPLTSNINLYSAGISITGINGTTFHGGNVSFDNARVYLNAPSETNYIFGASQGIRFGDGTIQTTAATTGTGGGGTGTNNVVVAAGTGTVVYQSVSGSTSTYTVALTKATSESLGGIKVGANLTIDGNGVLNANTASYYLPTASYSTLGGVKIVTDAGLTISNGDLGTAVASASHRGTIRVGTGLSIDGNGVLSGSATLNTGTWSLSSDARTNDYAITNADGSNYLRLDSAGSDNNIKLVASAENSSIQITSANTATITANQINLDSNNTVVIGSAGPQHSTLRVERIYNQAGTYAPFFPAGVQYADSTVQVTAYHSQQPGMPPPVNFLQGINWGTNPGEYTITTYAQIQAALAKIGSPTPVYFDGIYDYTVNHGWVYTGFGPLGGWFDENA
jgi:hypothetical protein